LKKKPGDKPRRWSNAVTKYSRAMMLESGVFTWPPRRLALSLKRSAEESSNLKSTPFRSAMSMLNFYINRAGKNLKPADRKRLNAAKAELRSVFGKA
jgi:hypothetical protein